MEPPKSTTSLHDTTKNGAFGVRISCIINRFSLESAVSASLVRDVSCVVYRQHLLHGWWLGIAGNAKCIMT